MIGRPTYGQIISESVNWQKLNTIHLSDPDIRAAIDFITDITVGMGFQTTMNEDYKEKVNGKTAKEIVDEKCEEYGIDELLQEITRDLVGYGNSFVIKEGFVRIPPFVISGFTYKIDEKGISTLNSIIILNGKEFSSDQIVWFAYNRIGDTPLGVGILETLARPLENREPMYKIKAKIQAAMMAQIENMGAYNELWVIPEVSDDKLKEYHDQIQGLSKSEGRRIAINVKDAKVQQLVPERMKGLDFYVETLWNSFYIGLETPLPKLFTSPGFTEASARAALQFGERKIYALQRYLKRMMEKIFAEWVAEAGLDPTQAQVRLNWRLPERPSVEHLLPILMRTWQYKGITTREWRRILINIGVDLEEKMPEELPELAEPRKGAGREETELLPGEKPILKKPPEKEITAAVGRIE